MRFSAALLLALSVMVPSVNAASITYGTPQTVIPQIGSEMATFDNSKGATVKLYCGNLAAPAVGTFDTPTTDIGGVGSLTVVGSASTQTNAMNFQLALVSACTFPVLEIDLTTSCFMGYQVVFDVDTPELDEGTLGSGSGVAAPGITCVGEYPKISFENGVQVMTGGMVQPFEGDIWLKFTMDFGLNLFDGSFPVGTAGCGLNPGTGTGAAITIDTDLIMGDPTFCTRGMDGEPHVKTWSGKNFDYMGECDLVLLHVDDFDGKGNDLSIHTRTTIRYQYSYIEVASIKIGDDILEVASYGDHAFNGVDTPFRNNGSHGRYIGGYPVHYNQVDKKKTAYDIVLGPNMNITLASFKDLVSVHMSNGASHQMFKMGSVTGLMGAFDGKLVGRDGTTEMSEDLNAYGQEWQVRENEPMLFRTNRAPQYPTTCNLPKPDSETGRRLGQVVISQEAAEAACAQYVAGQLFENCVYDVMALGDLDVADPGAY